LEGFRLDPKMSLD